jgi:hypothetical protein
LRGHTQRLQPRPRIRAQGRLPERVGSGRRDMHCVRALPGGHTGRVWCRAGVGSPDLIGEQPGDAEDQEGELSSARPAPSSPTICCSGDPVRGRVPDQHGQAFQVEAEGEETPPSDAGDEAHASLSSLAGSRAGDDHARGSGVPRSSCLTSTVGPIVPGHQGPWQGDDLGGRGRPNRPRSIGPRSKSTPSRGAGPAS